MIYTRPCVCVLYTSGNFVARSRSRVREPTTKTQPEPNGAERLCASALSLSQRAEETFLMNYLRAQAGTCMPTCARAYSLLLLLFVLLRRRCGCYYTLPPATPPLPTVAARCRPRRCSLLSRSVIIKLSRYIYMHAFGGGVYPWVQPRVSRPSARGRVAARVAARGGVCVSFLPLLCWREMALARARNAKINGRTILRAARDETGGWVFLQRGGGPVGVVINFAENNSELKIGAGCFKMSLKSLATLSLYQQLCVSRILSSLFCSIEYMQPDSIAKHNISHMCPVNFSFPVVHRHIGRTRFGFTGNAKLSAIPSYTTHASITQEPITRVIFRCA